jgi:hypothetical protein
MFKNALSLLELINNYQPAGNRHKCHKQMKDLFLVLLLLVFSVGVFSQTADIPPRDEPISVVTCESALTLDEIFGTFIALIAFIPIAVQFLRKLLFPNTIGLPIQIFSWFVGLAITVAGWALNLGFLDGLSIWMALLYGAGACLAANGIFDTGLITAIFGLFEKKSAR